MDFDDCNDIVDVGIVDDIVGEIVTCGRAREISASYKLQAILPQGGLLKEWSKNCSMRIYRPKLLSNDTGATIGQSDKDETED